MASRAAGPAVIRGIISTLRAAFATLATYLLAFTITFIGVCMGIILQLLGMHAIVRGGIAVWARMPFWLVGRRLHVHGGEHIARSGRYLVVANHSSMYDIPALLAVMPDLAIMGRERLLRIPVFGFFLRTIHYIPVETENIRKAADALLEAVHRARGGFSVGMFPEGTRTQTGEVQRLKRGFVRVLREGKLDLLPMHIHGTWTLKPKNHWYMDPHERIEVTVRRPISHASLASLTDDEIVERAGRGIANDGGKET